jgi:hypothetical protein
MAADFPTNLWIRDPVIDGRPYPGGALNRAMALLSQGRDEITAIETKLGTVVRGTAASLAARLAMHHAPSGLRRGQVRALRGPNTVGGAKSSIENWWTGSATYIQADSVAATTLTTTITFPTAYFAGQPPQYIIAKFWDNALNSVSGLAGSCQVLYDSITVTQFQVKTRRQLTTGLWEDLGARGAFDTGRIAYIAIGGAPS